MRRFFRWAARRPLGLSDIGRDARGATVEDVKAKHTRSWSTLHLPRWGGTCRGITVKSSTFGPAGTADGRWADGISLACEDADVIENRIVDATDGGIVIFGATGSTVKDNTIIAENRTLLGHQHGGLRQWRQRHSQRLQRHGC